MSTYTTAYYGIRNGEHVRLIARYVQKTAPADTLAIDLEFAAQDIPFLDDDTDWQSSASDTIYFPAPNGAITTPYGYPNTVLGAFAYVATVYTITR